MGSLERREREREETRQLILDAALKLWVEKGADCVTIRNIADEIEYTPGAIYSYFKDKDDIFYALHLQAFEKFYDALRNAVLFGSPLERLQNLSHAYLKFAFENPQYYDLMFISASSGKKIAENTEGWKVGEKAFDLLHATVKLAMDEGYLPKGNSKSASMMFWAHVHGIASLLLRERCVYSMELTKELMLDSLKYMMQILTQKELT